MVKAVRALGAEYDLNSLNYSKRSFKAHSSFFNSVLAAGQYTGDTPDYFVLFRFTWETDTLSWDTDADFAGTATLYDVDFTLSDDTSIDYVQQNFLNYFRSIQG